MFHPLLKEVAALITWDIRNTLNKYVNVCYKTCILNGPVW